MTRSEYISLLLDMTIGNPTFTFLFGFVVAVYVSLFLLRISHERLPSVVCGFIGTVSALLLGYGLQLVLSVNTGTITHPLPDWECLLLPAVDNICFLFFIALPFLFASSACALLRRHPSMGVSLLQGMRLSDRVLCWVAIASVPLSMLGETGGDRASNLCFHRVVPVAFAIVASSRLWRKTEDDRERVWARRIFIVTTCYAMFIAWVGWCAW